MQLILASASPRRAALLREAGYDFTIRPADVDEEGFAVGVEASVLPVRLAREKAQQVAGADAGAAVVLGADTVVLSSLGEVLGKPADAADARRMLGTLSGSLHHVTTGFCAIRTDDRQRLEGSVTSDVLMRVLTEAEIDAYVATGAWQGKAGGYGIQDTPGREIGEGDPFIEKISGELTNIIGLPMPQVIEALDALGVARDVGVARGVERS